MKLILYMIVFLFLAGCITEEKYIKKLDSWMGKSSTDLIHGWGKPDKIEQLDEHQFYVFYREFVSYNPPVSTGLGDSVLGTTTKEPCKTTFEIVGDKVVKYWFVGSGCIAR